MKNKWVKRIATAVATLAVAAGVFNGLTREVKAADAVVDCLVFADNREHPADDASIILDNGTLAQGYILVHVGPFNLNGEDGYEPSEPSVQAGEAHVQVNLNIVEGTGTPTRAEFSFTYDGKTGTGTVTLSDSGEYVWMDFGGVTTIDFGSTSDDDDDDDDDDTTPSGGNDSKPSDPAAGSSSSHKHHTHNWVWTAIVNATENQDGTYAMKCTRCNRVDESTITVIAKESVTSDKNLQILGSVKPGETIKLDTKGTAAFNQYFIAELMKHSDSPVVADFEYKNKKWTLTAPAGFNWTANLDDNGWAGFMSVAQNNAEVTVTER